MKEKFLQNETLIQLLKYGVVGGIAFIVDYGLLLFLTEVCGFHHLVSAAISFIAGLAVNYILSQRYVFTEKRFSDWRIEFLIFSIIGVVGLGLNELIIYLLTDILGIHYMLGKLTSTVIVFLWNFIARKVLVFSKKS